MLPIERGRVYDIHRSAGKNGIAGSKELAYEPTRFSAIDRGFLSKPHVRKGWAVVCKENNGLAYVRSRDARRSPENFGDDEHLAPYAAHEPDTLSENALGKLPRRGRHG